MEAWIDFSSSNTYIFIYIYIVCMYIYIYYVATVYLRQLSAMLQMEGFPMSGSVASVNIFSRPGITELC